MLYISIIFAPKVYAGTFPGGFPAGTLTYGIGGGSSSIADIAVSQWNGISSKVKLTPSNATGPYGLTANIITYFDSHDAPTAGSLGITYPFSSWTGASANLASVNDRWVKVVVYQYKNSLFSDSNQKIATATHELGHALSVAHPSNSSIDAVMQQGLKMSYKLRSYDKNNLISKWGR